MLFEDILDGYFPLRLSVQQLMARRGLWGAVLRLRHAPILHVPFLPPEAPVPLNISAGRAGMIHKARLDVVCRADAAELSGEAQWGWLDNLAVAETLDPMIRLAEPALVEVGPLKEMKASVTSVIETIC